MTQTWDATLVPADPDAPAAYTERRGAPTGDVTVRLQALDGTWEVCGADRARGVWPENVKGIRADQWGSKSASFDLRRDPKATWPDIAAFTRVQIDIDGRHRWSGRVAQTPVRDDLDSVISVQCEGMQAHLDDDLYERVYVHTDLTAWADARSFPTSVLTYWVADGQVNAGDGKITLSWPIGTPINLNDSVGVVLDLGPGVGTCAKVTLTVKRLAGNPANMGLYCRAASDPSLLRGGSSYEEDWTVKALTTLSGGVETFEAVFTGGHRYVAVFVGSTTTYTPTADDGVEISAITVYTDSAYESGDVSVLQADDIVLDALQRGTLLLSSDRTLVEAGTFNIPEFAPAEPRTPRQVWEAADAFEDRLKKIDLQDRAVYKAKPTTPRVEVGAWSAMSFEDASANDGSEVYSRVIVKSTQPDGSPLRVVRNQSEQSGVSFDMVTAPAIVNPSFTTDNTGWTVVAGVLTRDTGTYDTSPASGRWDSNGSSGTLSTGDRMYAETTGKWLAGTVYRVTFRAKASASGKEFLAQLGVHGSPRYDIGTAVSCVPADTNWNTYTVEWSPEEDWDGSDVNLKLQVNAFGAYLRLDSFEVLAARPTIVERRGFRRTKVLDVGFKLTTAAATRIADLWLRAHQRTPFKGTVRLTGHGAVRDIVTGTPLPVDALLDMTGELIRFSDRIDPDTGAFGRDARIAEVSVDPDTDEATVTLDNSRAGFDALLARLDVVLGQGTR